MKGVGADEYSREKERTEDLYMFEDLCLLPLTFAVACLAYIRVINAEYITVGSSITCEAFFGAKVPSAFGGETMPSFEVMRRHYIMNSFSENVNIN